ncbi:hypothetical protein IQ07DRAFT_674764 [Pyrenochaeta sp. DS3sAY3a]|nr:hypothetical protein IQ07DRAFT_674764 [Pyrenochaeta sp. DS3sAY3a]
MPPSTRIPPLLQPSIHLPSEESLLLLTSTLGASANWLIIRFLCDALNNHVSHNGGVEEGHNIVLVSWMREYDFWRQEARKGVGLDLEQLKNEGRFCFVDGLSGMCLGQVVESAKPSASPSANATATRIPESRGPQSLPARGLPARGLSERGVPPLARGPPTQVPATPPVPATSMNPASITTETKGHYTLGSLDTSHLKTTLETAISSLASTLSRRTLLILDNPDLLLALDPALSPTTLTSLLSTLHTLPPVSHILTHVQSDTPLLSASAGAAPQPLQLAQHNFLVRCAHMSRRIVGVRVLDTGVARDVSGVVRVTEQSGGWMDLGMGDERGSEEGRGREFLYRVGGDGGVRVFERGAGGEG